jgi:ubiquinone/menaquinone biosynthesis C-methylase UbiE
VVGDARTLPAAPARTDALLLLGSLYYLTEAEDRAQVLREARRVLRPRGLLFAVGISRFASLLDGLFPGVIDDPTFAAIVERDQQAELPRGGQADRVGVRREGRDRRYLAALKRSWNAARVLPPFGS